MFLPNGAQRLIYTNVLGRVPSVRTGIRGLRSFPRAFAQDGSKRLKKAQKGAKGLKKALEKAVRACPVPPVRSKRLFEPASAPPVRSKRLFEPASAPPVRSKRLFESAVQDHYSKVLHSANTVLCASLLCSPCSVHVYARVHASIYIYIRILYIYIYG